MSFKSKRLAIQDHTQENALFRSRALFCFAVVCILLTVLAANAYYLQVVSHKDYQTRANNNRIHTIPTQPSRGLIFDRHGELLAQNLANFTLEMIPEQVKDIEGSLESLRQMFNLSLDDIESVRDNLKYRARFKPLTIIKRLSEEDVAKFSVNMHRFPGFRVASGLKRDYPHKEALTHVLGYTGRINRKDRINIELEQQQGLYAASNSIGKQGIEKYYETALHGVPGSRQEERNNRGRVVRVLSEKPAVAGQNLQLTIDLALQKHTMAAFGGRKGAAVVIEPSTGEILAMVSSPSYDPNLFVQGISSKKYRELLLDSNLPLFNRSTKGLYAPASTVKPLLALAGLEHNLITPTTTVNDPGWWQIPKVERKYRDWKRWGHGQVNLEESIAESCDIYYYDLAYKMGIDKISAFMIPFGFGQDLELDMHEVTHGIMPTREWKSTRHRQPWYIGDSIVIGIGQGYWTSTPLNLAHATAVLANKGTGFLPHLLKQSESQRPLHSAKAIEPITLSQPKHWDTIAKAMYATAHKPIGSAYRLFKDSPYKAAVKSGTGQVASIAQDAEYNADETEEHLRDHALFVGWAPYKNPKISVAVIVENAGWGSSNAGPIAKSIMDFYLLGPNHSKPEHAN